MTDAPRPRRTCLYIPGDKPRAIAKARALDADVVMLDLEDAVAPEAKPEARAAVAAAVGEGGFGRAELVVRVNAADSEWGEGDLKMVHTARPDAVLVPKPERAADLSIWRDPGMPVWAMVETPRAVLGIGELAAAEGLAALVVGTNDLAKEIRAEMSPGREAFLAALSMTVMAARANGLAAIDGVFNDLEDADGFAAECRQGRALGFDGKTVIHPSQINPCNRVFAPDDAAIARARAIVAAFEDPANAGKGVLRVEVGMAERLHLAEARRLLALADSIAR
ncbi:MAG: CoA ester lyase [Parasphingopyxis sp.]